jgi:hypothetical protein
MASGTMVNYKLEAGARFDILRRQEYCRLANKPAVKEFDHYGMVPVIPY